TRQRDSCMHAAEDSRVESRSRPRDLVGEIDCVPLAHEIFLPAHAAIRRRLVHGGTLYCTYIWLTAICPLPPDPSASEKTMSPPTMTLPGDCKTGGRRGLLKILKLLRPPAARRCQGPGDEGEDHRARCLRNPKATRRHGSSRAQAASVRASSILLGR